VIVICPNCGTRYKLPDDIALTGKRMRCAECDHRWMIEDMGGLSEEDELVRVQETLRAAQNPADAPAPQPEPAPEVEPASEPASEPEPEPDEALPRRAWLGWTVALVAAAALGLLAASIWLERLDPARVPVIGGAVAGLKPGPSTLVLSATGSVSSLPSGGLLLDVTGEIRNTGQKPTIVKPLKATLAGPAGVVRRWTIAPPVAQLAAGQAIGFSSTLTDVPADARQLRLVSGG
jgi:predicted Zn finger-like uncharacterized protein